MVNFVDHIIYIVDFIIFITSNTITGILRKQLRVHIFYNMSKDEDQTKWRNKKKWMSFLDSLQNLRRCTLRQKIIRRQILRRVNLLHGKFLMDKLFSGKFLAEHILRVANSSRNNLFSRRCRYYLTIQNKYMRTQIL